jgi:hypothetical protein
VRQRAQQFGCIALALASVLGAARLAPAQNIQFPSGSAGAGPSAVPGTITQPTFGAPAAAASTAINPYTGGAVPFDPYSSSGSPAYSFWNTTPPSNTTGAFAQPPGGVYGSTSPLVNQPIPGQTFPTAPPTSPYLGNGLAPPPTGPVQPQSMFPNGMTGDSQWDLSKSIDFIQDLRLRHTYVAGGNDNDDLGINDTEAAVTFTLPNFLTTGQPLFISPAFALHLWDGPANMSADLPPSAYSAYLDFQWVSDPNLIVGAEFGARVGAYTDFNTLTSDSLRLQGLALGTVRLTPALMLKIGAMYIDRNDIKLLPAGGLLWTPNPQVRFDIFFPQPKLAMYLTTLGRFEIWGYAAGEYGGGAWTIERTDGSTDRIDINDIRLSVGIDWTGPRGVTGFFEVGYVFEREVVYVVTPSDTFGPPDSYMLRAGIAF